MPFRTDVSRLVLSLIQFFPRGGLSVARARLVQFVRTVPCQLHQRHQVAPASLHRLRPVTMHPSPIAGVCWRATARANTFQLAEVAVTGPMVRAILAAIHRLRVPPLCA